MIRRRPGAVAGARQEVPGERRQAGASRVGPAGADEGHTETVSAAGI